MANATIIKEYAKILRKYMQAFSLEPIDIAYLAKSTKKTIVSILEHSGSLELETQEAISQIFNLHYYEFGNPDHPIQAFESLPQKTKDRIAYRKKEGPHKQETYNSLDLNEKITIALSFFKEGDEFLIEELVDMINERCGDTTDTSLIGDRLSKTFKAYILKTNKKGKSKSGRGRRPYYFRLIKVLPKEVVNQAKETVGDKWRDKKK